jgi:hypothetical protein
MDTFYILGVAIAVLIASVLMCIGTYAFNIIWLLCLPFQGLYRLCGCMKYSDDDEGVCCCDGNCIV